VDVDADVDVDVDMEAVRRRGGEGAEKAVVCVLGEGGAR
jgi:hypothetical protein